jgi:glycosyltransferase involved in cell wall biosynthesis
MLSILFRSNVVHYKIKALKTYFINHEINAVLAEYGQTGAMVCRVCKQMKLPLTVHFHGFDAYRRDVLEKFSKKYKDLFIYADAIIVVSKDMYNQLIQLGAPVNKLHLNPYGVDVELFQQTQPHKNLPVFIAVGRFVEKKAPHLTIEAFKKVITKVPQAKLIMVGDGPLLKNCADLVNSYHLNESVTLTGPLPHFELMKKMKEARAFVQHSVRPENNDSEGTPVAILEACSSGLPIISTRHAGIIDAVEQNVTGFLVEEGDSNQMSNYMIDLALDPDLASTMGKAGRNKMLKEYNMEHQIDSLWKIIENTIRVKQ